MKEAWITRINRLLQEKDIGLISEKSKLVSLMTFTPNMKHVFNPLDPTIIMVLSGKLTYAIGEDERLLELGEYLFYPMGITVHTEADDKTLILQIQLKKELVEQFIAMLRSFGSVSLDQAVKAKRVCIFQQASSVAIGETLCQLIDSMVGLHKDHDYFINLRLCELLYHIFPDEHMLSKIAYVIDSPYYPEPIILAESFMLEHYNQALRMKQIIEIAMVSESHLNRLYQRHFNMSTMERLTAIRMEQAAQLLRNPSLAIMDVAVQVGYQSISAFVQQFKRKFKKTPKAYQRKLISKAIKK